MMTMKSYTFLLLLSNIIYYGSSYEIETQGQHSYSKYTELTQTVAAMKKRPPSSSSSGRRLPALSVDYLHYKDGTRIEQNFYRMALPRILRKSLVKYAERLGVYKLIDDMYFNPANTTTTTMHKLEVKEGKSIKLGNDENWFYQRPSAEWLSDIHWISPADKSSHDGFLEALASGGFGEVLNSMGRSLGFDGISCYQLSFVSVRNSEKGFIHNDFNDTGRKAYNFMIPMNLVPGSEPELDIVDHTGHVGRYKYQYEEGVILGDEASHATAKASNGGNVRLLASVYIGDINEKNSHAMRLTQNYPPNDPAYLLRMAGEHWKPDGSTSLERYLFLAGRELTMEEEIEEEEYSNKVLLGLCLLLIFLYHKVIARKTRSNSRSSDLKGD